MKLNNKGFAITGFLYSIFAIFLVILSLLIISMTNSKLTLDRLKKDIKETLDEPSVGGNLYEKVFSYTGSSQEFVVPYNGWYKVELWGAQGNATGKGAYTSGKIYLGEGEVLYLYIGQGDAFSVNGTSFNGGTSINDGYPGGGATDVRLVSGNWDDELGLKSRIMIAAGAGSGSENNTNILGAGGTLVGNDGTSANGGTQLTYGTSQEGTTSLLSFGKANGECAGGGGYYPGGGANCTSGAGGGSSFISGYAGVNAITSSESLEPTNDTIHYSGKYFIDGYMEAGVNSGNGKAKITYLSENKPQRINLKLNNVRYIKDCINGSGFDYNNEWIEIQAIRNGVNVAKGKTVIPSGATNPSSIVDGDISPGSYTSLYPNSHQCIIINLGDSYDLDEIAVWHNWANGTTYNDNVTSVSTNNINWVEIINKTESETPNGKRVSAYDS